MANLVATDVHESPAGIRPQYSLASIADRLVATVLDHIFLVPVYGLVGMWVAARMGGVTDGGFELAGGPAILALASSAFIWFLYYWLSEASFGATLGKGIVNIAVRSKAGGRPGIWASLARNLWRIADGIGFYLIGLLVAVSSTSRQRIGDRFADTVVVDGRLDKTTRVRLFFLWCMLVLGVLAMAWRVHHTAPESAHRPAGYSEAAK